MASQRPNIAMTRFSIALAGLIAASFSTLPAEQPTQLETPTEILYGTLTTSTTSVRDSKGPVALIIAGSGPTDRDGNTPATGTNNSLKLLAAALAEAGFASVAARPMLHHLQEAQRTADQNRYPASKLHCWRIGIRA